MSCTSNIWKVSWSPISLQFCKWTPISSHDAMPVFAIGEWLSTLRQSRGWQGSNLRVLENWDVLDAIWEVLLLGPVRCSQGALSNGLWSSGKTEENACRQMGNLNFWSISGLGQMVKIFSHLSNVYIRFYVVYAVYGQMGTSFHHLSKLYVEDIWKNSLSFIWFIFCYLLSHFAKWCVCLVISINFDEWCSWCK